MKLYFLNKDDSLKDSIKTIKVSNISIGLVLEDETLIGVITQGDILKFIYDENSIFGKVKDVMTLNYIYTLSYDREKLYNLHCQYSLPYIPIISSDKKFIGLSSVFLSNIILNK
tara:strand:+ start:379 stop:720 length:342 start_codon:yes stop_codon:yes gene_type:complete